MNFQYFSQNGQILPLQDATVSLTNIEYAYGFGVYENIKIRNRIVYFAAEHIERLISSAKIIKLEHEFTEIQILNFIDKLIQKNDIENANLKILLIGAKQKKDASLNIIPLNPLYPDRKFYKHGVNTITLPLERNFPRAKTLNMLTSYLAFRSAKEKDCYDALALDSSGNIIEGTRTNFFALKNSTLFSAPEENILDGVTRRTLLEVAFKNNFVLKTAEIKPANLSNYDGAILTGTSAKIMPIKKIDDFEFSGISESIRKLMHLYDDYLTNSKGVN